ncbi:MAG TPA: phospholipase [Thermoguttaceae bacterium]|nr:phospholipase [Thermoguttaceae bacterium]
MTSPKVESNALRTLHRIHRQLSDLRERLARGPKQMRACEANVAYQEGQFAKVREETRAIRMATDAKQVQLFGGENKIKELKIKLNAASSNREYQVLQDQIAAQEMTNSVLADEILEGLERIDECKEKVAEAEANVAKAREKSEKVHAEVQEQEPLIRGDLERLEAELKQCEANLPADVQELYQRVVRQRGEDAMAEIENGYCGGCHQNVPLNVQTDIMLDRPKFCKTCGRMLYLPEDGSPT